MRTVFENRQTFLDGLVVTGAVAALSYALAFAGGILLISARLSVFAPVRLAAIAYTEILRNSPLPVLLLLTWFGAPKLGIDLPRFATGVIVLALYTSTFISETLRAGINCVPPGEVDAARALGFNGGLTMRVVVIPQALRAVVQPLGTVWIAIIKSSAVVSFIAVPDLLYRTSQVIARESEPIAALACGSRLSHPHSSIRRMY